MWQSRISSGAKTPQRINRKAIASVFIGLQSFWMCLFAGGLAIALAIEAFREIHQSQGRERGSLLALVGLGASIAGTVFWVLALTEVRRQAPRTDSATHLRTIATALNHYHEQHGRYPPAVVYDRRGRPLYSWRVLLLPLLDCGDVYQQFRLDEAWNSPANRQASEQMPTVYECQPDMIQNQDETFYTVLDGPGALFNSNPKDGLQPCPLVGDGHTVYESKHIPRRYNGREELASGHAVAARANVNGDPPKTFLVVEAEEPVGWSEPVDLKYQPGAHLPAFGRFWSNGLSPHGFNAAFIDGSVRFIHSSTAADVLGAYITGKSPSAG